MNLIYISIDACCSKFLSDSESYGLSLPNLRKLAAEGTWASQGAKSVFPSFTYPCHATMETGVFPDKHGIVNNLYFDPEGKLNGAWYWYAKENGVPTLWDVAHEAGYTTANVGWSSSIGADLDYDLPQVWLTSTPLDVKFINGMSRPQGLALELERAFGRLTTYKWDVDGDQDRTNAAIWLLENKIDPSLTGKNFFMTVYYAGYDDIAHNYGKVSKEASHALEETDRMVGELVEAAKRVTDDVVFCIVSDHGMLDNEYSICPNVLFANAGLIRCDADGNIVSWDAYMQRAGGTAEVRLRDPKNQVVREKVEKILRELADDPNNGIEAVLNPDECKSRRGFPNADFALIAKRGYELRENVSGEYLTETLANKAQHGYSEDFEEMRTIFILNGKDIEPGIDVNALNLVDFAPTVAKLLGIQLPCADGVSAI